MVTLGSVSVTGTVAVVDDVVTTAVGLSNVVAPVAVGWAGGHSAAGDDAVKDAAIEHARAVHPGVDDPSPVGKAFSGDSLRSDEGWASNVAGHVHHHADLNSQKKKENALIKKKTK